MFLGIVCIVWYCVFGIVCIGYCVPWYCVYCVVLCVLGIGYCVYWVLGIWYWVLGGIGWYCVFSVTRSNGVLLFFRLRWQHQQNQDQACHPRNRGQACHPKQIWTRPLEANKV